MARIHGKHGQVKMDPTGAGGATLVVVDDMNAWTLDASKDLVEVTAFLDVNKVKVAGLPDYTGTLSGWWSKDSAPDFFAVVFGDTPAALSLIPSSLESGFNFAGPANIDGSVNCSATGAVSIAGTWSASGAWTFTPGP